MYLICIYIYFNRKSSVSYEIYCGAIVVVIVW